MPRSDDAGQAMTEYAILMALIAGLHRVQEMANGIAEPRTLLLGGVVGFVLLLAFVSVRGRR
jgi:hypothetical protein